MKRERNLTFWPITVILCVVIAFFGYMLAYFIVTLPQYHRTQGVIVSVSYHRGGRSKNATWFATIEYEVNEKTYTDYHSYKHKVYEGKKAVLWYNNDDPRDVRRPLETVLWLAGIFAFLCGLLIVLLMSRKKLRAKNANNIKQDENSS